MGPLRPEPSVPAFHEPLSLIRSLLIRRLTHGNVRRMKIGGRSVTAIGSDFVWRQAGVTYDVLAKNRAGVKRLIASFR
jgi:hypothetical protein